MRRLRLKADGRIVEITAQGEESVVGWPAPGSQQRDAVASPVDVAEDAILSVRALRERARLTQTEFAARLGVPVDTIRNWEQGKRDPRGPARALLQLVRHAPDMAFSVLARHRP